MSVRAWALALVGVVVVAGAAAAQEPPTAVVRLTGRVLRVAAVGGETTGWALDLDAVTRIGDRDVRRIEVAPADTVRRFEGQRVDADGTIAWRTGVERGRYPVFQIDHVSKVSR